MLAETGSRLGRYDDAENLLARAVELAPSFAAARHNYATVLHRQFKSEEALAQADRLIQGDPANPALSRPCAPRSWCASASSAKRSRSTRRCSRTIRSSPRAG